MVSDNVYVSNTTTLAKYMKLEQKGKVLAEYIWIDGTNGLRNKTKVSNIHVTMCWWLQCFSILGSVSHEDYQGARRHCRFSPCARSEFGGFSALQHFDPHEFSCDAIPFCRRFQISRCLVFLR